MLGYDSEPYHHYGGYASAYSTVGVDRYSMRTTSSTSQFYPGVSSYSRSPSLDLGAGRSSSYYGRSSGGGGTLGRSRATPAPVGGGWTSSDAALRRAFAVAEVERHVTERRHLPQTPNVPPYRPSFRGRTHYDGGYADSVYTSRHAYQPHTVSGSGGTSSWQHARSLSVDRFGGATAVGGRDYQHAQAKAARQLATINGYESDPASHDDDLSDRGGSAAYTSFRPPETSVSKAPALCVRGHSLHSREASEDSGYYSNGTARNRHNALAQHHGRPSLLSDYAGGTAVQTPSVHRQARVWRETADVDPAAQHSGDSAADGGPNEAYRHSLGLPAHPAAGVGPSNRIVGVRRIASRERQTHEKHSIAVGDDDARRGDAVGAKKPPRPPSPPPAGKGHDSPSSSSLSSDATSGTLGRRVRFSNADAPPVASEDGVAAAGGRARSRARVHQDGVTATAMGGDAHAHTDHRVRRGILRSNSPAPLVSANGCSGDGSGARTAAGKEDKLDAAYKKAAAAAGMVSNGVAPSEAMAQVTIESTPQLGIVGLRNIGNTCFMNSIIQCLSHTKPLRQYCLKDDCCSDINFNTALKGALIKAFCEMMEKLWSSSTDGSFSPREFKMQMEKYEPRFRGYSQQDSQEFLRYCLQGLHDEVNRAPKRPANAKPLPDIDAALPEKEIAAESWRRYLMTDNSRIVDIFVGQLKSQLQCTVCGHKSVTFDPFWDLSLPIPRAAAHSTTLAKCLDAFFKEETLDRDEMPMCDKCKCRRKSTRTLYIHKLPRILVLHLKRFSGERYKARLSTKVDFPLKQLDVSHVVDPKCEHWAKCTFDLYAVSNHMGTALMGHYTANVRHALANAWYLFDDERVRSVAGDAAKSVVTSDAYVLFYEAT